MLEKGRLSEELGRLAEDTFEELLKIWCGLDIIISKDEPDRMGIDRRCVFLSKNGPAHQVVINWQIKARSITPNISRIYKEPVFVLSLGKSEVNSLTTALSFGEPVYLALAIPSLIDLNKLLSERPEERFDWFVIDLRQYMTRCNVKLGKLPNTIHIPKRNKINLASISLLWGSVWFSKMVNHINKRVVQVDPILLELAKLFLWDGGNYKAINDLDLRVLPANYLKSLGEIPPNERYVFNFIYGTAIVQSAISNIIAKKGQIESYSVYAAEGLGEGINLWFFSRQVRSFLNFTTTVCGKEYLNKYIRMFPVKVSDIMKIPKYIRCALFNAMRLHRTFGVTLGLVEPLDEDESTDHVYVENLGNIRSFVVNQEDSWKFQFEKHRKEDKELLAQIEKDLILEKNITLEGMRIEMHLKEEDVAVGLLPIDMFPPEDRYLEYPKELFSNVG